MSQPPDFADGQLRLAGIRRRLVSMIYEGLLLVGVLSLAFMVPHLILGMGLGIVLPGPALFAHIVLVFGVYFLWYWRHGGQTLAMQTWRLRLATPDGQAPSNKALVVRFLLSWPSLLFYGAGLFYALFDRDRQFLHDRLAGTCVIDLGKSPALQESALAGRR